VFVSRPPPSSTLFPYTTLFRSILIGSLSFLLSRGAAGGTERVLWITNFCAFGKYPVSLNLPKMLLLIPTTALTLADLVLCRYLSIRQSRHCRLQGASFLNMLLLAQRR